MKFKKKVGASSALKANAEVQHKSSTKHKAPWLKKFRFAKGESGNPGGKPAGLVSLTAQIKAMLARGEKAQTLVDALYEHAIKGDMRAMSILVERNDGALEQSLRGHFTGTGIPFSPPAQVIISLPSNGREANAADLTRTIIAPVPPKAELPSATSEPEPVAQVASEPEPTPEREPKDPRTDGTSSQYIPACFRTGVLNSPLR